MWRDTLAVKYRGFGLLLDSWAGGRAGCFHPTRTLFWCYLCVQGAGSAIWRTRFCKFSEPLCPQGASSNFLVLKIKSHKRESVKLALAKRAWKGGFCSIILRSGFWDGFILNDLNLFCFWGIEMKFPSSKLLPADYGHRVVPACGSGYESLRGRGWNWTAQKVRAVVGVFLQKESPRTWVLCWVKDIRYLRRYGLRWQ